MNYKQQFFPVIIGFFFCARVQGQVSKLDIGSNAPGFKIAEWIKGEPVTVPEMGKVNIIEFTIVGCGPCIKAIPHLTALNKKYNGKINLVSVFADGKKVPPVKELVKTYSSEVNYPVAVDMPDEYMKMNWMYPAGRNGYPTVFVVDQKGTIAWIGNPLDEHFDEIVENVYGGTFDKYLQREKEKKRAEQFRQEYDRYIMPAEKGGAKELQVATQYLDSLIAIDSKYLINKYYLLLEHDEKKAYEVARKALNERVVDGYFPGTFYHNMYRLKNPDWNVFRDVCRYLYETDNKVYTGYGYLRYISDSYYLEGKYDSALMTQNEIMKHLKQYNANKPELLENEEKTTEWLNRSQQSASFESAEIRHSSIDSLVNRFKGSYLQSERIFTVTQYNNKENQKKGYKTFRSLSLQELYRLAYLDETINDTVLTRIVYDFRNVNHLEQYFTDPFVHNKLFNYTLTLPGNIPVNQVMQIMQKDLRQAFGYEGKVVTGPLAVWKLTAIKAIAEKSRSKELNYNESIETVNSQEIILKKKSIYMLVHAITTLDPLQFYKYPIINETGLDMDIDLTVKIQYRNGVLDMAALQKELKKKGFELTRSTKQMKALVISEAPIK